MGPRLGTGRGTSPNPPFPPAKLCPHLITANAWQSLNELRPAAAVGWRGQVPPSRVLVEPSCRGVTLGLGGAHVLPPHRGRHMWVRGSVSHTGIVRLSHGEQALGDADHLLGHTAAVPGCQTAFPGQIWP